ELCGVRSLAFAVGAYLPLSTTLPIFAGGVVRWAADWKNGVKSAGGHGGDEELGGGNLYATGLVAGGAIAGVVYAIMRARWKGFVDGLSLEDKLAHGLGQGGYDVLG